MEGKVQINMLVPTDVAESFSKIVEKIRREAKPVEVTTSFGYRYTSSIKPKITNSYVFCLAVDALQRELAQTKPAEDDEFDQDAELEGVEGPGPGDLEIR